MTDRDEFTSRVKVAAFLRAGGFCERCKTVKLAPGNVEYDHDIPAALGGAGTLENCVVCCRNCHRGKTKKDRKTIAKSNRIWKAHIKASRASRPIPGSRSSPFKKHLDGRVTRR